jgi:hypothetical protein
MQPELETVVADLKAAQDILMQFSPKPHWSKASQSLVNRLRGIYAIGPHADQGIGEFGFRSFPDRPPIQFEAAARIVELENELQKYRETFFDQQCKLRGI